MGQKESVQPRDWLAAYLWPAELATPDAYVHHTYVTNDRLIGRKARQYAALSPVHDAEELMDEAYIAVQRTCELFDRGKEMKISTYLHWQLQKQFSNVIGHDNVVEVRTRDGNVKILEHATYQKKKKTLEAEGAVCTVKNRYVARDPGNIDQVREEIECPDDLDCDAGESDHAGEESEVECPDQEP